MRSIERAIVLVAVVIAMTGSSLAASAQEISLEALLGVTHHGGEGLEGVSGSRSASGTRLLIGVDPGLVEGVGFHLGWELENAVGSGFAGELDTSYQNHRVMVGADYRPVELGGFFRPLVRVSAGFGRQELEFETSEATYRGVNHGAAAYGGAGAEVVFRAKEDGALAGLAVGATTVVGYLWQSRAEFTSMESTTVPEEDLWQRGSYEAGALGASGISWSLGLNIRYRFLP